MLTLDDLATSEFTPGMVPLSGGRFAAMRPLSGDDAAAFGEFLATLGAQTRRRYNPHPLTASYARQASAAVGRDGTFRVLAVLGPLIRGYVLVSVEFPDDERQRYAGQTRPIGPTDCRVAPVVHPEARRAGVGSAMLTWTASELKMAGYERMVLFGGTQTDNVAAVRMYKRLGFTRLAEFRTAKANNVDMYLELDRA